MQYGRKAYGHQRRMPETAKVRNIAASIRAREREGQAWTWADYGWTQESPLVPVVLALLSTTTTPAA